ncbi:MAG: hypothetical protein C3F10_15880 [Dehalococcoidia bacterium]|nr:MAG: hypothetical protein C3F10_15880 [Dehalococcoidia bacterium]
MDREREWHSQDMKVQRQMAKIGRESARASKDAANWQKWSAIIAAGSVVVAVALFTLDHFASQDSAPGVLLSVTATPTIAPTVEATVGP